MSCATPLKAFHWTLEKASKATPEVIIKAVKLPVSIFSLKIAASVG